MRGSSLKSILVTVAALALAGPVATQAAISVGPTGSAVLTFDALPAVGDFSTMTIAGGGGDAYDPDVDIQTRPASGVTTVLGMSGTIPISANALARWHSTLFTLMTPPTGVRYTMLMATLQNDSGANHSTLVINYTLGANDAAGTTRTEETPGHAVYYSLDGIAWTRIAALNSGAPPGDIGSKSAEVALSAPWVAGTTMFVAWLDDNAGADRNNAGNEEGGYTIDDLQFQFSVVAPNISVHPAPNTTVDERGNLTLSVVQSGGTTIKWFKGATELANGTSCVDGHNRTISGATTATLTIAGVVPGDAGSGGSAYHCEVSNSAGMAVSTDGSVTVTADTTAPTVLYALCGSNPNEVVIVFSEPLNDSCAMVGAGGPVTDPFNWVLQDIGGQSLQVAGWTNMGTMAGQTALGFVTGSPHDPTKALQITWTETFTDASAAGNALPAGGSVMALCYSSELLGFSAAWQYNDKDVDPGATWKDVGFTDNAPPWATGTGPFDSKRDAGLPHPNGLDDCRATALHALGPVGTCINLQSPVTLTNLITAYARTHFNFSGTPSTSVLVLEGKADDGMVVYLNGTEVWRVGMANGAVTHTTLANRTVGDGDAQDVLILGSPASLVNGDNTLAVEFHQVNLTSSDLTMGLKVSQLSSTPPVRVSISYSGGNVTVTWSGGTSAGTLRSATSITTPRPWPVVTGAVSPYTTSASGPQKFFEVSDP